MNEKQHDELKKAVFKSFAEEYEVYKAIHKEVTTNRVNRLGQSITLAEWMVLAADSRYTVVAKDIIDDIRIFTIWQGLPDDEYGTYIIKGTTQCAGAVCENEESALKLHAKVLFLIDQKMWSFDDVQ